VVNALLLAVMAGLPSGFGTTDLDGLAASVDDAQVLAPALDQRLVDLVAQGGFALAEDSLALLAPLAERVGLPGHRAALEDEAFRILEPGAHAALVDALPARARDTADLAHLGALLATLVPDAQVDARVKSLWSLQRKMRRKGIEAADVYDRLALRLVLPDEAACYGALEQLVDRYPTVPGELDDYIAHPKASGYQALHLAVRVPVDGRLVTAEVQIKTAAMHAAAEHGPAAHWRYKAV
jgi:GTP pyrophosphokinase